MPNFNVTDESEMTDIDRPRIDALERKLDQFITSLEGKFASLEDKFDRWDDLYYAFTGNKFDNKAGIMNRIIELEQIEKVNELRIKKLEDDRLKIISYALALSFIVSSAITAASVFKIFGG